MSPTNKLRAEIDRLKRDLEISQAKLQTAERCAITRGMADALIEAIGAAAAKKARREALEEAAKVAEDTASVYESRGVSKVDAAGVHEVDASADVALLRNLAAAIRALGEK